jgi:pimeloyl-ACP methyl ester carboxylesterase
VPLQTANGTQLYYELRGNGPALLLIMGASGYGGLFDRFAELLSDEFTVVSYDRRGNGRSPRPSGWEKTSPEEQADDAAALLDGLGLAPAPIFGTSSGGVFALATMIRHPAAVTGAVLHEPALFSFFDDPQEVRDTLTELITDGLQEGGPATAFERFIRFVAGDENWDTLDRSAQERMLATAHTYFGVESGAFDAYLPADAELASITMPTKLLVSTESLPPFTEAAMRLAERLGIEVSATPGTHFPYLDHPAELAAAIKPFLRGISPVNPIATTED